jgi:hypothetical protein
MPGRWGVPLRSTQLGGAPGPLGTALGTAGALPPLHMHYVGLHGHHADATTSNEQALDDAVAEWTKRVNEPRDQTSEEMMSITK